MKNRIQNFVSVLLLIVYGTLTFVTVPLHQHSTEVTGCAHGEQTVSTHADADNCKHRSIEIHSDCGICSYASQSVKISVVQSVPQLFSDLHFSHEVLFVITSNYSLIYPRRGPPTFLV